jgi:hypothetical protein
MTAVLTQPALHERAMEVLRRTGNPFRNYFARNPDDETCARYHVPELYAREREQLLAVVDWFRNDPTAHSEVVPVLGNKGSGKTHLLHSIKHGSGTGRQLLVTPGTYQKGTDFLEYLLFQILDTLLGGGKQGGVRPLEYVGQELTRRLLCRALSALDEAGRAGLFPATGVARWARRLGLGLTQAEERIAWLVETLSKPQGLPVRRACQEAGLDLNRALQVLADHVERTEIRNTAGQIRRRIYQGFARACLLGDEAELAQFLTYGFAELDYQVRPTRQELVLALTKVLMELLVSLRVPVVVAFDQLEDLLLVRRTDDGRRTSEAFFAGIVQVMHQVDGICFLIFAERGLWNRFVPSLDGYIQDRLNNPVHVPGYGTIKALKLEPPPPHLVWQVVAARLKPALSLLPEAASLSAIFPFTDEQVSRIARTEPTLRDMLQQFRHLFDYLVYGNATAVTAYESGTPTVEHGTLVSDIPPEVKSVTVVDATPVQRLFQELPDPRKWEIAAPAGQSASALSAEASARPLDAGSGGTGPDSTGSGRPAPGSADALAEASGPAALLQSLWQQAVVEARQRLEPEGALTGATRELQAGLGTLLQLCQEHGVRVAGMRLSHVVPDYHFGNHPTYGALCLAHWTAAGQTLRSGIGLFLGRGPGKPKDLQVKLSVFDCEPPVLDRLVLLRPADDVQLSGKSKAVLDQALDAGRSVRIEPVGLDEFAILYGFPRWLASVTEALPAGAPLPNLADFLQDRCAAILELACSATKRE